MIEYYNYFCIIGTSIMTAIISSLIFKKVCENHIAERYRKMNEELYVRKQQLEKENKENQNHIAERYRKMNEELRDRKQQLEKENQNHIAQRYQFLNQEFLNLTGVTYSDFKNIITSNEFISNSRSYHIKARKYVSRLEELNRKRMLQLQSKPVMTTAADMIKEDEFCRPANKEQALLREIEICRNKALELGIKPPVGTSPTSCEILRVIDGDTFLVKVGDNSFKLRVMGFDTPEVCHPTKGFGHWGIQASAAAENFISQGSNFQVFMDKKSIEEHNLCNDRYGRIVGHLMIDGELFGHKMLSGGHAEVVDFFPIQKEILAMYRRDEFEARQDNIGMWKEINEYQLSKHVERARENKYSFQEIIETKKNVDFTKEIIRQIFADLIGTSIVRSTRGGGKIHKHDCRYVGAMNESEALVIDEDWIKQNSDKLQPCKVCNGDDLVLEAIS